MDKTVKELADAYGMSKQAMRKHINQLPTEVVKVGDNRTTLINEKGQEILRSKLSTKATTSSGKVADNSVDTERYIKSLEERIEELKKDKENLQKQIEIKDEQIAQWSASATTIKLLAEQKPLAIETVDEQQTRKWYKFWK